MKILNGILKVLLLLILIMPVLGTLGIFPEPDASMYTTEAWAFMSALMEVGYVMPVLTAVFLICAILVALRYTALAMVLLAPLTVNIVLFHWFLDATPISASSIPAHVLLLLNLYFAWQHRSTYKHLLKKD